MGKVVLYSIDLGSDKLKKRSNLIIYRLEEEISHIPKTIDRRQSKVNCFINCLHADIKKNKTIYVSVEAPLWGLTEDQNWVPRFSEENPRLAWYHSSGAFASNAWSIIWNQIRLSILRTYFLSGCSLDKKGFYSYNISNEAGKVSTIKFIEFFAAGKTAKTTIKQNVQKIEKLKGSFPREAKNKKIIYDDAIHGILSLKDFLNDELALTDIADSGKIIATRFILPIQHPFSKSQKPCIVLIPKPLK